MVIWAPVMTMFDSEKFLQPVAKYFTRTNELVFGKGVHLKVFVSIIPNGRSLADCNRK